MGRLENEPTTQAGYEERITRLERMIGRLAMENEVLKKGIQRTTSRQGKNGQLLPITFPSSQAFEGGAAC